MNKLEMAHQYAIALIGSPLCQEMDMDDFVTLVHDYADKMVNEYESRQDKSRPEVLDDFEVDWSEAPCGFNYWAVDSYGAFWYRSKEPKWSIDGWSDYHDDLTGSPTEKAPMFNYNGSYQLSIRKRPE